jgi:hypothetical protein
MAEKPKGNVTQRSWSNYEGPKPYQDKVGTDFYYASRQYSPQASPGANTTQRSWSNYQSPVGAAAMGDSQPSAVGTAASKFQQLQDEAKARKTSALSEESDFDRLQRESALKRGMRSLKNTAPSATPAVDGGSMLS